MTASKAHKAANGTEPHPVSGGPVVQLPSEFGGLVAQAWIDLETGAEHLAVSSPIPPTDGQAPFGAAALGMPHGRRLRVLPLRLR
ncbi:hypothetical protein ACW0JT_19535 [Arthrobacter sp. SA17]